MHAVHLPVLAGAWLLVGAGLGKTWRPAPTQRAIRAVLDATRPRLRIGRTMVRWLGVLEIAAGFAVLAGPWAAAVWPQSGLYAGFAVFVVVALATGAPLRSCGCFGAADAAPSAVHVAIDTAVAAFGVAVVTDGSLGAPRDSLTAHGGLGAVISLAIALVVVALLRRPKAPVS